MSRADLTAGVKPHKMGPPSVVVVLSILEQLWRQSETPSKIAYEEPLDGLIETVLSQNTNDHNRDMAFADLKASGTWNEVALMTQSELAKIIKKAGICNNKAKTILRVLPVVKERFGGYSLKELKNWTPDDAFAFMTSIPGVGPKTAACVLAFDLAFPAFPVDTHVSRISKRMGWAEDKETPAQIQEKLECIVPPGMKIAGHLNMIQHGKQICKARAPKCPECPLRGICPSEIK